MRRTIKHPTAAVAMLTVLALTGCATSDDDGARDSAGDTSTASAASTEAEQLLAERGLDGTDTVELIDHLDRLGGADRPKDLFASVRPDQLVLAADDVETSLPIPDERFYLSIAPYLDQTHECFNHSLTTCTGELASTPVQVRIVDNSNDEVLVDETVTTFANGFVGFWLPRDIEAELEITYDGKTASSNIGTGDEDPTCLTTLQLT